MSQVLWALGLLVGGAVVSAMLIRWARLSLGIALSAVSLAAILCLFAAIHTLSSAITPQSARFVWPLPLGSMHLAIDGLSAWFLLPIGAVGLAVAIYSWDYFRDSAEPIGALGSLMCVLIAGMTLSVCADDVVLFMIGWELMSLSAFFLVGFHHRDPEARHGAWMYLVATHLGTALGVLPVLATFVGRSGSTSFDTFVGTVGPSEVLVGSVLCLVALVGFGTKAGLMPMHVWLPAAHPVAPSPVSALMSGVVIKTGAYGFLRVLTWLPPVRPACALTVVAVGALTGTVGILYALPQRQYKRMLAYSSVENMGIVAMGIGLGMLGQSLHQPLIATLGFGGALLHVLNHSLFKGLLFLSAGAVLHGTKTGDMERLGGIARRDPANATLFLIGSVAICALPPLNGLTGEFLIYSGFARNCVVGSRLGSAVGVLGICALAMIGGLALSGFSKLFGVIFLGEPRDVRIHAHPTPRFMIAGMGTLAAGCALIALGAPLVARLLTRPVSLLLGTGFAAEAELQARLRPLTSLSLLFLVLIMVGAALLVLRRKLNHPQLCAVGEPTWGCGYSRPSSRMQYTGSSYVWNIVQSFRSIIRPRRTGAVSPAWFPRGVRLETQTADAAVRFGYRPLFKSIARGCEKMWPLQHGRIQLYLIYIVAAVIIVFAVERAFSPFPRTLAPSRTQGISAAPPSALHVDNPHLQGDRTAP